eukprot:TRINITY_DN4406_c0_g1_i2.p1 TRINITY_DN4406_c0_g1~~TRINITY_DN4406_c0_g1_i2.p1  ORF type:complete len:519 (+),score=114.87 TRINITY_DN4406_c0_g1_i2:60-1616(+)
MQKKERVNTGPPQIHPHEIELGEKLAEGCFGSVYVGRSRATDVAIKVPKKQDMTPDQLQAFIKEVEIMSNIYAPNITLFMGACTVPGKIMMVTELLEGDFETLLRDPKSSISLYDRMCMVKDAAQGVSWLHGSNIIHRDLKTSNLLYDKTRRVKVCDFGFSQLYIRGKNLVDEEGAKGTPLYMAPEVMLGDEFNEKADVYSFGIVLWEALTRQEPFTNHSDFDSFVEAVAINHERPILPDDCLQSLRKLISRCWAPNPTIRPSFPEIVEALEKIIVECAVDDPTGRLLWLTYFNRKDHVSWEDEFVPVFAGMVGAAEYSLPDPVAQQAAYLKAAKALSRTLPFLCLAAVLTEKKSGEQVVTLEKFGQVLRWFGPFRDSDGRVRILQRIENLLRKLWFHGSIDYDDAVIRLRNKNPGTFLVRFSGKDHPGCFTFSKVNQKKKIAHQRIMHKMTDMGSQFYLKLDSSDGTKYPTLPELVEKEGSNLFLKEACPESPYSHLFQKKDEINEDTLYQDDTDSD